MVSYFSTIKVLSHIANRIRPDITFVAICNRFGSYSTTPTKSH
jgi:hypothetical protein